MKPQPAISEEDFHEAIMRYSPEWLDSYVSTVIGYGIDSQVQLASGKIRVTFSTLECAPEQDEDDDTTYGWRFVCIVAFNEDMGRWFIEEHEEPTEI